jgi:hypothetical protein
MSADCSCDDSQEEFSGRAVYHIGPEAFFWSLAGNCGPRSARKYAIE